MSDTSGFQGPQGTDGTEAVEEGQGPPQAPEPSGGEGGDSLGNAFLERVPPEDRPIVEPYVKQWDAGVTRRFQALHSTYDPYREFVESQVDPTQMQNALQLYELLDTNPQQLYLLLQQEAQANGWGQQQGQPGSQIEGQQNDAFQGLPPQVVEQITTQQQQLERQQQALEAVAGWIQAQTVTSTEAAGR